jgi:hypothetical protein
MMENREYSGSNRYRQGLPQLRLLQRHLHTHVYCSAIHNSQVMETAKMPHY